MAYGLVGRKLIQMGLDFTGKQMAKKSAKKAVKKTAKMKAKRKPKPDARSKAFYDSIYKHL